MLQIKSDARTAIFNAVARVTNAEEQVPRDCRTHPNITANHIGGFTYFCLMVHLPKDPSFTYQLRIDMKIIKL